MGTKLKTIAKMDWTIYIVCLLALLACLYTINSVATYQLKVNENWQEQWEQSGCIQSYTTPDISYNLWGFYNDTANISHNT